MPNQFDIRQLRNMPQMPSMEMPRKPTVREMLMQTIERGEKAKELLKMLDESPITETFVNEASKL